MLEETTTDSSAALSATSDATPQNVPNEHENSPVQYSSRRAMREATERPMGQRRGATSAARVAESADGDTNPTPHASVPPVRMTLSREDRVAARKLNAAAPALPAAPAAFVKKKTKRQNPAKVLLTLLIVPGFIASASLPAYALIPAGAEHQAEIAKTSDELASATAPAQELSVDSSVASAAINRDAITATSEAELQAQQVAAAALAAYNAAVAAGTSTGTVSGTVSSARSAGDDYPWPGAANTLSPLAYYYRQCVDFVAWRLNRDAGSYSAPWKYVWSNLTPGGGNASEWKRAWESHGWTTSSTPVIGAVAWFNGNHVAYVKEVVGANVIIEEYNGMVKRGYAIRTIPASSVGKFLYPPPR